MANKLMLLGAGKSGSSSSEFAASLSIAANDSAAAEDGSDAGQFTVTLSVASGTDTVIAYSITGTATATTDYTALSGTVTIIASATTATIDVSGIIDDAIVEANETVIVTLDSISSGDDGITIDGSANAATVTITDDDMATVSITANDAAAAEDGSDPGQFTVTQTAVSSTNTVIAYSVTGDATPTTDYTALSGSVIITAGSTTATIDVTGIIDDSFVEANETVTVTLDSISSGDAHVTINTYGSSNVATVTITDDDVATVSIIATDATAAEDGSDPGQFTVTQTQVSSTDTVIAYSITGTATATTDYTALSGTVTIAAGVTTAFINVSGIIDDAIVEGDETVIVTLDSISSGDSHVTINGSANVATVTITDDESSITVIAPNGSESWDLDTTESITWSDVNLTGNVKIELYKDGSLDSVLSADTANTGSYSWAISDSLTAAADYKIRITSLVDGTVYDESDANFTLVAAASITVVIPNGGEDWIAGVEQTVTWTSANLTGNVDIKLYDDDEVTLVWVWNTANDGEFSFTPDVYRISDKMKIWILSTDDASILDKSDADFTIALPTSITVTAPNGSEEWQQEDTESITWSSVNLTGNVKIELYKDGSLDSTLTSEWSYGSPYSWAIAAGLADGIDYKIRITSLVDGTVYDESDAVFEVGGDEESEYDPPAVSSGLIVKLDAGDPSSFDSGDDEVWTNTVDSVEGDFLNGPVFDEVDSIKSIYFDGSDDAFHLVRDNSDLDDGKFTLVSWFMPVDQFTNGSESFAYIWNFGYPDPGFGWVVYGKMMSHGWGASGYPVYSGGDAIVLDEWHMAAFVSDGAGTIDSFLNNVKAVLPDPTDHDDFDTDAPSDDFWFPRLGSYAGAGYNSEMKIAQFLIYDRALSDAEITDLWNGDRERFGFVYQEPSVSSGLVVLLDAANPASYDPAEPTKWINTIDDEEGTLTNGPVFESGGTVIGSLSFDGTDDFFNLTRDNSGLTSGWSLVVWINPQELTSSGINGWFINLAKTYPYLQMGILSWPGGGLSGTRGYAASGLNPAGWVTWDDEAFVVDQWHQFVLVNQNDGTVDLFLNNVKDTSPPTGWVEDEAPGDDILAGAYSSYGTASAHLETKIAQILLYDRSLTDQEVEDLYNGDKARFGVS